MKPIFITLALLASCILHTQSYAGRQTVHNKELQTIDRTYEPNIRTVLLYPNTGKLTDVILPPVLPLSEPRQLLLSFDELGYDPDNYYVRILNCNSDWSVSNLNAIMYLHEYNEFQIMDRQTSYNTRRPYTHYKFVVPRVKISGNFLIKVYREGDEDDLILTRRFMVYENNVTVTPQLKFPVDVSERNTGQQPDFSIYYNHQIQNPMERMKVVVRQNYNWSNAIYNLEPVFMRDDRRTYEYTYFGKENVFKGLNEFRFFDLRSLRSNGMNVAKIIEYNEKTEVLLGYDKSRKKSSYGTSFDLNGFYAPEHYETKGFETEPDYAEVTFTLDEKPVDVPGRVFLMGAFTNWGLNADYELKYDSEYQVYTCTALLKQGYYNYMYALLPKGASKPDLTWFEGSFSTTQNVYDFIVYYRGPGDMFDRIVGYKAIDYLNR
jgi:hypothetical protein